MSMKNGQNCFCSESACTITSMGSSVDPLSVDGTVAAGCVCTGDDGYEGGCMLAQIYFPTQVYRAGFTPENALQNGTMFPELVRCYK